MIGTLNHRGPDDSGVREEPHAVLGMTRLAIIDTMFGTADHHLKSLARAGGLGTV